MKISSIAEGHWTLSPDEYPNSMSDDDPESDRHSPLLDPDDRERFVKWGSGDDDVEDGVSI